VIFVILSAFILQGNARKVCILYEQKIIPPATILSEESISSISITEETLDGKEGVSEVDDQISDVPETIAETTEEISIAAQEVESTDTISKISKRSVISSNSYFQSTNNCGLEGITLFDDQNDLLRKMCSITSSPSSLYVVTVQNSVVKSDLSLATLCAEGPKGLLSWIAWQDFIEKVRPLLSTDELPQLVVRNLSISGPSESSGNKVDALLEVLFEMLPVRYQLTNMTASAWNNITFIKPISLGKIELENANDTDGHIEGDLSYSFPIETNTTFLSSYPIAGLSVEMLDESDVKKNFIIGSTNTYIFNDTFSVERLVPAFKKEIASLKAKFGIHEYDIEGKIVSIFGLNTDGTTIKESHTIRARVVTLGTYDIKDAYYLEDYTTTTEKIESTTSEELPIAIPRGPEAAIYPGFQKVFYVACVLFFGTLIIAAVDVIRKLRRDRKEKTRGRRAYVKVNPKF